MSGHSRKDFLADLRCGPNQDIMNLECKHGTKTRAHKLLQDELPTCMCSGEANANMMDCAMSAPVSASAGVDARETSVKQQEIQIEHEHWTKGTVLIFNRTDLAQQQCLHETFALETHCALDRVRFAVDNSIQGEMRKRNTDCKL